MRGRHVFWIASWLAIGMSGCTTLRPPRPDTASACANWRWIGISRPEARCPEVPGWTMRPLFGPLAAVQGSKEDYCKQADVPGPDLIRELNRFCVYEIADKGPVRLPLPPPAGAGLIRLDQDCAGLSLSERYLDAKSWMPDEPFLAQAGKPREPLKIDHQNGVRLAFLDTQPDGEDVPQIQGSSPHGFTLARIAQQLVCTAEPHSRCAAQITTRLALPILYFDAENPQNNWIDRARGGYLGMQSDLAEAIASEVDSWWTDRWHPHQRHLILNLSMAWDDKFFGGFREEQIAEMRAGTQAVYRALQYAKSLDVLVLAAAGNQQRAPCDNIGPLLPAAWENEAPSASCQQPDRPLVYAVGGLQANDHPLANARSEGMPRRAAYGATTIFTGSSVATAVASSIAAVVWDSFPNLHSNEVMAILDRSGTELFPADFWFRESAPSSRPMVHKLSLCAALKEACKGNAAPPCPLVSYCETSDTPFPYDTRPAAQGSCQPWNYPQPEDDPCAACIKPPK